MHPIVVVCIALLLGGVALGARWGGLSFAVPATVEHPSFVGQFKRGLWFLDVALIGGIVGGLLAAGAGGRLAMRLLAVTAGDEAQGRITEADQIVGEITVGGSIGFIIFGGLFAGFTSALIYLLIRKWLPAGWLGGVALGTVLLVMFGTRTEPLRANNPDFDLVGPGWLSVLVFVALAFVHSVLCVGVMARVSRSLPVLAARPKALLVYLPLVPMVLTGVFGVGALLVVAAGAAVSLVPQVRRVWADPRLVLGGRVLIVVAGLALLPGFVGAIAEIV
jgi:hypothetical protein